MARVKVKCEDLVVGRLYYYVELDVEYTSFGEFVGHDDKGQPAFGNVHIGSEPTHSNKNFIVAAGVLFEEV